ncbi:hypothetical protein BH20VER3_BH20VER3_02940 [soil metagenome]
MTTPDGVRQYWETRSGDSLGGGSDLAAYFGVNRNTLISEIEVTWPSGTLQTVRDVSVDQRMTLVEKGSSSPTPTPTPLPTPQITVTSPNGRETWSKGNTYTVTWTDDISGNVMIRLLSGRRVVATIAASTPSDGSFDWTVPTSLADGNKYRVEVSSLDDGNITDQSDRRFTITTGQVRKSAAFHR